MHAVQGAPEVVGDFPVFRVSMPPDRRAPLYVLAIRLSAAADVRADRRTGDRTAGGCHVPAPSGPDLMAEHAADDGADNCTGNVDVTAVLDDLAALDPAALLRGSDDGAQRSDRDRIQPFARLRIRVART